VIELDRSENHRIGEVVHEFRSLVEEGRVIFIAFQDEVLALAKIEARAKVFGNAADQK